MNEKQNDAVEVLYLLPPNWCDDTEMTCDEFWRLADVVDDACGDPEWATLCETWCVFHENNTPV